MLNYLLLIGRVTKITKPVGNSNRPAYVNITFDDVDKPNQTDFVRATTWNHSLVEELEFFRNKGLPVVAYCSVRGRMYNDKKTEDDSKTEEKGNYYFDVILNKLGYFGKIHNPLTAKELPHELVKRVSMHGKKLEYLEKINWWGTDSWSSKNKIHQSEDQKPEDSESKKICGDTLKETEEFIKVVDGMDSASEDSDQKPEDSTSKDDNQDSSQDQNT